MIVVVAEMGERSSLGDAPSAGCLLTVLLLSGITWNNVHAGCLDIVRPGI